MISDQEYKKIPEGAVKQAKVLQAEIIQILTQVGITFVGIEKLFTMLILFSGSSKATGN